MVKIPNFAKWTLQFRNFTKIFTKIFGISTKLQYLCTEFNKHAKQTIKNLAAKLKKLIQLTKKK